MKRRQNKRQRQAGLGGLLLFLISVLTAVCAEAQEAAVGRYHAVVIGNRQYRHFEELPSAEADAREVARMLEGQYGFTTELLLNAGREQILRTLSQLPQQVRGPEDSLIIYYAGHSRSGGGKENGHWLPSDAGQDGDGWISTLLINNIIKALPARHVLLVSGSCYAANLIPPPQENPPRTLRQLAEAPSMTVLTAGCGTPLRDSAAKHSLFAWTLLRILHDGRQALPASLLAARMQQELGQPAVYGHLSAATGQGDFLFLPTQVQEDIRRAAQAEEIAAQTEAAAVKAPEPERGGSGPGLDPAAQPQAGDVMIHRLTGMEFVYVPGGCFTMGAGEKDKNRFVWELPAHEVCVDGFWMGKHEVTQAEWEAVMGSGSNPSGHQKSGRHPVENVSWEDAQAFLGRMNSSTGRKYRLPTEAEWEYACRAGGSGVYCGGDAADELAWHEGNSGGRTHEAGSLRPNAFGLYDMSGNVWEWCSDKFAHDYYRVSIRYNPQGAAEGDKRVVRGGSLGSKAQNCRASFRFRNRPDYKEDWLGFRIVLP